jgi:hypothetical protein
MDKGLRDNPSINDDHSMDGDSRGPTTPNKQTENWSGVEGDALELLQAAAYLPDDFPAHECMDTACTISPHAGDFLHFFVSILECLG